MFNKMKLCARVEKLIHTAMGNSVLSDIVEKFRGDTDSSHVYAQLRQLSDNELRHIAVMITLANKEFMKEVSTK